jgi:hypothetical protein
MAKILFTKEEVEKLMMQCLECEDWDVHRYRDMGGSLCANEKEAREFISRKIFEVINE